MALKDIKFRNAKPQAKPFKLSDGEGLHLLINPNGSKWWRFRYTFEGREKGISFGVYPDITLESARKKRAEARALVAEGIDPSVARKEKKAEGINTFKNVSLEWFKNVSSTWAKSYRVETIRILEVDLYPFIGDKSINKIAPGDVLAALRKIESRAAFDSAHRTCRLCGQIFRYAIASGMATVDPSMTLKAVLRKRDVVHYPAITEPKAVAILLRALDAYEGTFIIKCALRLLPNVFCRPGELRHAEWSEIDFDAKLWAIPAEKMKMRQPHLIPLSRQSIEILKSLHEVTGAGRYVFPSSEKNGFVMGSSTLSQVFTTTGYAGTHTAHGFRATARTLLDEVLGFPYHLLEHQLSHAVRDPNGTSYNRTSHLPERQKMMQTWSDYLDGLRAGAKIIPFKRAA